ncbi:DMT family transporter [Albidovulum sp.]|uniref:DMT family transporter n=1 Tax=Albidovulum sp. TaxID=1872424 RepID=UPI0039B88350
MPGSELAPQKRISAKGWGLLFLLSLIWGASFVAISASLTAFPVLTTVALRVGLGAAALWVYVLWAGLPVPLTVRFWRDSLIVSIFNNILTFLLVAWGQTHIPSGMTGILNASTALFAVLVAAIAFPDERLTLRKLMGVSIGLCGVAVIVGPDALTRLDPTSLGQLAILAAGLSNAMGAAWGRRSQGDVRPEVTAAATLTLAAVILGPLALMKDGLPAAPGWKAGFGVAYLALIATAFGFVLFYRVLQEVGASNIGLVTLLIAPIAAALGALLMHERLSADALTGTVLLIVGLAVLDGRAQRLLRR